MPMQILRDDDADTVYVSLKESTTGVIEPTHQYEKFGVNFLWDGHGELLGVLFKDASKDGQIQLRRWSAQLISTER